MGELRCSDALEYMRSLPAGSVDLVLSSPPYEDVRSYSGTPSRKGEEWVSWMVEVVQESLRICSGLVVYVVEGKTRRFRWSATPVLLMADLHRAGVTLRKPPIFRRVGIPGSGGPDWLRNDYEFIVCATNGGKLPWSENTAMGQACKWPVGGDMSYRGADGLRVNGKMAGMVREPKVARLLSGEIAGKLHTKNNGSKMRLQAYTQPDRANPGNVVSCVVGGGRMGSLLAHENEAPFPESLAEFFVRSFCRPGGTVCDPFCGSGTSLAVAKRWGREYCGCDVRQSQVDLTVRRLENETGAIMEVLNG